MSLSGFSSLVPVTDQERFKIMKDVICKDANQAQLEFFYHFCHSRGFDPFAREVFLVVRNSKDGPQMTIQTSIDAMRSRAEANGDIWNPGEFTFESEGSRPTKCTCVVYRRFGNDWKPYQGVARWEEFFPGDAQGFMWKKMPFQMLSKCAEAQALRRAAPRQLGQIYAAEENQAISVTPTPQEALPPPIEGEFLTSKKADTQVVEKMLSAFAEIKIGTKEVLDTLFRKSVEEITDADIKALKLIYKDQIKKQEAVQ